jgi:hypothetical protein
MAAVMMMIALAACGSSGDDNDAAAIAGADVVSAFQEASLEAEGSRPMTPDDYGLAPFVCDGTRFFIPSLGTDSGGRVFVCSDHDELESLKAYYEDLAEGSAVLFSWVFDKGTVLVQINGELDEEAARQYEAAIP